MTSSRAAVSILFASSVGWGLTWVPIKALHDMGMDSMHMVLISFLSGLVVLLPITIRQFPQWKPALPFMLLIAFTGGTANASFQNALAHGDVVRVMILFYLLPLWSIIGGRVFLGEQIDKLRALAVILCLGGASLVLDVWRHAWGAITWIDVLAMISGLGLAATNILFRFTPVVPHASKVGFMFMGCSVLIVASIFIMPPNVSLPSGQAIMIAVLYGGVYLTMITLGTQWGVTHIEAGRSAVIIVTELIVAVVTSAAFTDAALTTINLVGVVLVMSAALLEAFRSDEPGAQLARE